MLHRQQARSGHRAAVYDLAVDADGFFSAAADGYLVHWHRDDVDLGRVVATVEGGKFLCLDTVPGGLVAGTLDGGVHWLYPDQPDRNRHVARHAHGVFSVVRVEDEVFTAGGDGVLCRWSVATARTLESVPLSKQSLRRIAYDPVYDRIAAGASDGMIYLLDRSSLQVLDRVPAHPPSCFALDFSADGEFLFSGGRDAILRRWSAIGGKLKESQWVTGHLMTINSLAIHPEGNFVATAGRDKTVKIWGTKDLLLHKVVEAVRDRGHVNSVNTLAWLDDRTLITAGDDRRILEWQFSP